MVQAKSMITTKLIVCGTGLLALRPRMLSSNRHVISPPIGGWVGQKVSGVVGFCSNVAALSTHFIAVNRIPAFLSPWPKFALGAVAALAALSLSPGKAQAATAVQSFTLTDTFSSFPAASSIEARQVFATPLFTVQPFNANLGTLTNTVVVWSTSASFTGASASGGGTANLGVSGSTFINTNSYSGNGNGNGTFSPGTSPFSVNLAPVGVTTAFLPGSGNPAFQAAFTGPSPYTIKWFDSTNNRSPNTFRYTNIASGNASFTTTASVTYDYVAAPAVPGPLPLLGVGAAFSWSRRMRKRIGSAAFKPNQG
jgi:hypothetical protein